MAESQLRATSYRAFNGDINFPSPEAMKALLSCNQIAISCNCKVDDLKVDDLKVDDLDCTVDEEDEVKKAINDELNDDV